MSLNKMLKTFVGCLLLTSFVQAQNPYTVDITKTIAAPVSGLIKMGSNKAPNGDVLDANSLYFLKNGKPWYPVMGEIHFSRYPRAKWEEAILKMKAAGIDVIASYVFWINHEEEKGKFDWAGQNDLRAFVDLCKKHKVFFFARIGPWCHGEARNGGLPDWLMKMGKDKTRKSNPEYLAAVQQFYSETAKQLSGLYFKDGGPIIGAQIENEFRFNNAVGLEHILTLKKMAREAGIDVPFYTATAWQGANLKQDDLVPVWGAYPEAPWSGKTTKLPPSENYIFATLRSDPSIGSDLLGQRKDQDDYAGYRYPYATAEMGGGNQITYHRRPIIEANDVTALTYVKVGSGANLMGYYMFQGGSHQIGKFSTLQESRATKYPNDYPIISYDFLSPLGEWGQVRESYKSFKTIHTFLNDFGDRLVQYYPAFPEKKPANPADTSVLKFAVRAKGDQGFVFISNFQRQLAMKEFSDVQFTIKSVDGDFTFPKKPITIKNNLQAIFPFNMDLEGANLKYATTQPFCKINGEVPIYVFFALDGVRAEYLFEKFQIRELNFSNAQVVEESNGFSLSSFKPGTSALADVWLLNGRKFKILTLSAFQATNAWKASIGGNEHLFISNQELTFEDKQVHLQGEASADLKFSVFPDLSDVKAPVNAVKSVDGIFSSYAFTLPAREYKTSVKEVNTIKRYRNKGKLLPWDTRDSVLNKKVSSPGPQYQTNLINVEGARNYEISLPAFKDDLDELYLKINYAGDTGAAYLDGKLIADDFYSGLPMTIGLKRFSKNKPQKLLFQIVPLTRDRQIYFEDQVKASLTNLPVAKLDSVQIVPKYEVTINASH